MKQEIWKDIQEYEGCYQISSLSRVKSLERIIKWRGIDRILRERVLSIRFEKNGYQVVGLHSGGIEKKEKVHRLLAIAFIPNPENKPEVNHKNGNKADNRIENLEWVTCQENILHSYKNKLQLPTRGNSKIVLDLSSGIYYDCATDAAKAKGIKKTTLVSKLNGWIKNNNTQLIYV